VGRRFLIDRRRDRFGVIRGSWFVGLDGEWRFGAWLGRGRSCVVATGGTAGIGVGVTRSVGLCFGIRRACGCGRFGLRGSGLGIGRRRGGGFAGVLAELAQLVLHGGVGRIQNGELAPVVDRLFRVSGLGGQLTEGTECDQVVSVQFEDPAKLGDSRFVFAGVGEDAAQYDVRTGVVGVFLESFLENLACALELAGLPAGLGKVREHATFRVHRVQGLQLGDLVPVGIDHGPLQRVAGCAG
jgi:hypothetical protein